MSYSDKRKKINKSSILGFGFRNIILIFSIFLMASFILITYSSSDNSNKETLKKIDFSFIKDKTENLSVISAFNYLKEASIQNFLRTNLDESPYWIRIELKESLLKNDHSLLFFSRHVSSMTCWTDSTTGFSELGSVSSFLQSSFRYRNGAWIISDSLLTNANNLICRIQFIGPASLSIYNQRNFNLEESIVQFERKKGFLEGGLVLMMGLTFVAALLNRSVLFLCSGFWLFGSLSLGGMSMGWDHQFFSYQIPLDFLPRFRMIGITIYFSSTLLLASNLFENFKRDSWTPIVRILQIACVCLATLAVLAPYRIFLVVLWPLTLLACVIALFVVLQNFLMRRDAVSGYYLAGMAITLLGAISEVFVAWFKFDFFSHYFNSGSVTLLASVMTAVSLMEFVRQTQAQRETMNLQLEQVHERLINIFNIAPAPMFVVKEDGNFLQFNRHFENEFLYENGEPIFDFLSKKSLVSKFSELTEYGVMSRDEFRINVGEGQVRWFELILAKDHKDLVGVVTDFTTRKDRELALQHQATHDELTGALNKRGLESIIRLKIERKVSNLQLYHVDIKKFRHVIRAYGLAFSDRALRTFYSELYRYMCAFGDICRVHIDQFVIVINEENLADADEAFSRFRTRSKSAPFWVENRQVVLDLSTCFISFVRLGNVVDVIEALDETVRESKLLLKQDPHTDHRVFSAEQAGQFLDRARAVGRLGMQELPRHLMLAWQPILSLHKPGSHLYAEALLRIRGEDGAIKSAAYLINACVQSGQTALLDSWVLNTTISFLERNIHELRALDAVSVNVSPSSLNDEFFLEDTIALIQNHSAVANKLCFEVTEVGAVVNLKAVQEFIQRVRGLGVRIALDDFGAGYSNFRYAIDLHADVIKIDGSIIQSIAQGTESMAVAKAITSLSQDLGCKCVAEWVEDAHTLRALHEISVDYVQGFYISEAIDPEEFLHKTSVLDLVKDQARKEAILDVLNADILG